ncbi:hypothetical protein WP8W19C02_25790 [Enterobacter cloacae]|uniref:hypothetical protein n=1 Tax=Enterobacter mori TaxID=539813 RepID=UPI0015DBF55A|nr:hypothetical protein [Enterobacter mori]BBT90959.1 hypothetical protein WP8W19C02_25790 [Enterobacter cloacae]
MKKVSQYALGELGFVTLDKASASFDLIDGIQQPNNVVKGILEQLYKAAKDETRATHALNKYNYQRLLELIDSNHDGCYWGRSTFSRCIMSPTATAYTASSNNQWVNISYITSKGTPLVAWVKVDAIVK